MRKIAALALSVAMSSACGSGDQAASTPSPSPAPGRTHEITGRIMGPAGDARDTVDRLNDRQERTENGGGG